MRVNRNTAFNTLTALVGLCWLSALALNSYLAITENPDIETFENYFRSYSRLALAVLLAYRILNVIEAQDENALENIEMRRRPFVGHHLQDINIGRNMHASLLDVYAAIRQGLHNHQVFIEEHIEQYGPYNFVYVELPTVEPRKNANRMGFYETILSEMGFKTHQALLRYLPEDFIDQTFGQVITTPVCTQNTPQYIFDKTALLAWLQQHPSHPFTRQALNKADLRIHTRMKQAIDKSIRPIIAEYLGKPYPSARLFDWMRQEKALADAVDNNHENRLAIVRL